MSSLMLFKRSPNTLINVVSGSLLDTNKATVLFCQTRTIATSNIDARKGNRERVVILGSGWAGAYFVFPPGDILPYRRIVNRLLS